MTFQPGTRVVIDGRAFVIHTVHGPTPYYVESYTVRTPGTKRCLLARTKAGIWRYGLAGKTVQVTT